MDGREGAARTYALTLVVLACFSVNSLATRFAVSRDLLDAGSLTALRFGAGAAVLALLLARGGRAREALPGRADAARAAFLGAYALCIAYGYRFIGAAAGTFVFYACVVSTMALGGALRGDRPPGRVLAGAAVSLLGVGALAHGRVEGATPLGVLLLALTGATWGAYSLLLRGAGDATGVNARAFVGVAFALPLVMGGAAAWDEVRVTPLGVGIGVAMGAVTTALAYALWARVLPRLGRAQAGAYQLLVPVLTAAGGVLLLGEPLEARLALSGALVLAGMALATPRDPPR